MEDRIYHIIEIVAQFIGFGYIIFKGGRWIGESSSMFKTLFSQQAKLEKDFSTHQAEDDEKHEKVVDRLTQIQVNVAGIGKP